MTAVLEPAARERRSLSLTGRENQREKIDFEVVTVLPQPPFVLTGHQAIGAVMATPTWDRAELSERHVSRPQEGLIVVAYRVHAEKDGHAGYEAWCSSVYRRLEHEVRHVGQHQQTPVGMLSA